MFEEGYDSNGEHAPLFDMEALEGEQDFDKIELPEGSSEGVPSIATEDFTESYKLAMDTEELKHIAIIEDVLTKINVKDLKNKLKLRGQTVYGNKKESQERLKDTLKRKKS